MRCSKGKHWFLIRLLRACTQLQWCTLHACLCAVRRSVPVWAWDEAALAEQQRQRSEQARAAVSQPQSQYTPYANMGDLERAQEEHKAQGLAYHAKVRGVAGM